MRNTLLLAWAVAGLMVLWSPAAVAAPRPAVRAGSAPFEPNIAAPTSSWFQRQLDPYGYWLDVPSCGRVWQPAIAVVGARFKPYASGGRWVDTDVGWTFVTDWPFDAIVWHYGRWLDTSANGWVWVPGTTWGPAWVTWRTGPDLIAWAPLPPRGAELPTAFYSSKWCVVPATRFLSNDVGRFDLPIDTAPGLFLHSHMLDRGIIRAGVRYPAGPSFDRVQALSKVPLLRLHVVPPRPGVVAPIDMAMMVARQRGPVVRFGRMSSGLLRRGSMSRSHHAVRTQGRRAHHVVRRHARRTQAVVRRHATRPRLSRPIPPRRQP